MEKTRTRVNTNPRLVKLERWQSPAPSTERSDPFVYWSKGTSNHPRVGLSRNPDGSLNIYDAAGNLVDVAPPRQPRDRA
jgi:hypothetical protein